MTIRLQTGRGTSLYEQIYGHIKGEIRDGKLLAGERLPSTRALSEYLQVARSTVEYAYGQLMDEGYIEARPYKGYFVCPVEELAGLEGMQESSGGKQENGGRCVTGRIRGEAQGGVTGKGAGNCPGCIDFSPVDIDMSGFPFRDRKSVV